MTLNNNFNIRIGSGLKIRSLQPLLPIFYVLQTRFISFGLVLPFLMFLPGLKKAVECFQYCLLLLSCFLDAFKLKQHFSPPDVCIIDHTNNKVSTVTSVFS